MPPRCGFTICTAARRAGIRRCSVLAGRATSEWDRDRLTTPVTGTRENRGNSDRTRRWWSGYLQGAAHRERSCDEEHAMRLDWAGVCYSCSRAVTSSPIRRARRNWRTMQLAEAGVLLRSDSPATERLPICTPSAMNTVGTGSSSWIWEKSVIPMYPAGMLRVAIPASSKSMGSAARAWRTVLRCQATQVVSYVPAHKAGRRLVRRFAWKRMGRSKSIHRCAPRCRDALSLAPTHFAS